MKNHRDQHIKVEGRCTRCGRTQEKIDEQALPLACRGVHGDGELKDLDDYGDKLCSA